MFNFEKVSRVDTTWEVTIARDREIFSVTVWRVVREKERKKTANKLEAQRMVDQMEVQVEQSWKEEKTKKLDATAA
jgi:hypothetical protein